MAVSSVWKGSLAIGLVNVGAALYKSSDDPATKTAKKQLHNALVPGEAGAPSHVCLTPLNQQRVCTRCNVVNVPMTDVIGGVPDGDGFVIISDDELAALKVPSSHTIAIDTFVPADSIDGIYVERTYYLGPDSAVSAGPLALMRDAMAAGNKVFTGRLTLSNREHPIAIRPYGKILVLELLRSEDELRDVTALPFYANCLAPVDGKQLAMAGQLLGMYAGDFDPTAYQDAYVAGFEALVAAKKDGTALPTPVAAPVAAPVVDIMPALTASLAAKVPPPVKTPVLAVVPKPKAAKVAKPKAAKTTEAA